MRHPLFYGDVGMWAGILIRPMNRLAIRFAAGDSVAIDYGGEDDLATETAAFDLHGEDLAALARHVAGLHGRAAFSRDTDAVVEDVDVDVGLLHPGQIDPDLDAVVVAIGGDVRLPAFGRTKPGEMEAVQIVDDIAHATDHAGESDLPWHRAEG
jgi:hypothetical protein